MNNNTNPFSGLDSHQLGLLEDVFNEVYDDIRHYEDAQLGWDAEDISAFGAMYSQFRDAAKAEGCWWAR